MKQSRFYTDRELTNIIQSIFKGRTKNIGSLSLSTGVTSTTVTDVNAHSSSVITFMPTNAAAATELASGSMYVSSRTEGSFVITHTNSGSARTFEYVYVG